MSSLLVRSVSAFAIFGALSINAPAASVFLDFNAGVPGTIQDVNGLGTGFTSRLPGTGVNIAIPDPLLFLNTGTGRLVVTGTNSDLNGQGNLVNAEFVGFRLTTLGYNTGDDFSFSSQIFVASAGGYSQPFDQFGIFVGSSSTQVFRAGGLFTNTRTAYSAHTNGTVDTAQTFNTTLAPQLDETFILTLARTAGVYSVSYNNLTNAARSGTLAINQPTFLNGNPDLYVGVYIMNSGNNSPKALRLDNFGVEVASVPEPATFGVSALALAGLVLLRRRGRGPGLVRGAPLR